MGHSYGASDGLEIGFYKVTDMGYSVLYSELSKDGKLGGSMNIISLVQKYGMCVNIQGNSY